MRDKQIQKAGDNSKIIQAGTVIIGIDEKRVREILSEQLPVALKCFAAESKATALSRSTKFNSILLKRMVQESALTAFSDPSFNILLTEAQKSAASTEREQDYDLLSELMVHRFQKGSNRTIRAGISRAVEIVDQVSDDALLGITVFHSVSYLVPTSGDMEKGLNILDELFSKVIYDILPRGNGWLEHLDILDAVRISYLGSTKLLEDYWYEKFDGYLRSGIEQNSEKHIEAIKILARAGLGPNSLVKNAFNIKYLKLLAFDKNRISNLLITIDSISRPITEREKIALEEVYGLYDGNKMSKEDFIKVIEKYPSLKKLREWWNTLKEQNIQITSVGRVLAHSNVQRIDKSLPPLD